MLSSIDATISTRANVHFDGRVVSHTLELSDGSKKMLGVLLPASFVFIPKFSEVMEIIDGYLRIRAADGGTWLEYRTGNSFALPKDLAFEFEVMEPVHYLCHLI